jgi:hypothetical protein
MSAPTVPRRSSRSCTSLRPRTLPSAGPGRARRRAGHLQGRRAHPSDCSVPQRRTSVPFLLAEARMLPSAFTARHAMRDECACSLLRSTHRRPEQSPAPASTRPPPPRAPSAAATSIGTHAPVSSGAPSSASHRSPPLLAPPAALAAPPPAAPPASRRGSARRERTRTQPSRGPGNARTALDTSLRRRVSPTDLPSGLGADAREARRSAGADAAAETGAEGATGRRRRRPPCWENSRRSAQRARWRSPGRPSRPQSGPPALPSAS